MRQPPHLETLARHNYAGVRAIGSAADPDGTRQRINDWISRVVEDGGLFISAALHKANIAVDEEVTEAVAATTIDLA